MSKYWTREELSVLFKVKNDRGLVTLEKLAELVRLIPTRSELSIRGKLNKAGVRIQRKGYMDNDSRLPVVSEDKGYPMIQTEAEGNIYFRAAKLISGDYEHGVIKKGGRILTATETLKLLGMVREHEYR